MTISADLLEYLKEWEKLKLRSSHDPAAGRREDGSWAIYDIGYGHVIPRDWHPMECTREQADAWLIEDAQRAADAVDRLVTVPLLPNERDALISFTYNVGVGRKDENDPSRDLGFAGSQLLELLNSGDYEGAVRQMARWNKSGGKMVHGLVKRRAADQAIFRYADYSGRP